jgi:alginate production protein
LNSRCKEECRRSLGCRLRTAAVAPLASTLIALASTLTPLAKAAESATEAGVDAAAAIVPSDAAAPVPHRIEEPRVAIDTTLPATTGLNPASPAIRMWDPVGEHVTANMPRTQFAQFQLPDSKPGLKPAAPPPELTFQYAYGSDSEILYRRNADLNNRVRDNSVVAAPTIFALATYRPTRWLEATFEATLERQIAIKEESQVLLPSGEVLFAEKRRFSLLVDQAYVRIKGVTDPFEIMVGRRNFEDARLWLYDAALDSVTARLNLGLLQTDLSFGRENWKDLDLISTMPKGQTRYYILHSEYRGIEDHRFAAYAITLRDRATPLSEGKPWITGVRAYGRPTDQVNYWTDVAVLKGSDPAGQNYRGWAFDVGATYRFTKVAMQPSFTVGYAYGSGDSDPNDSRNKEFRQTGLQSNEGRFGGLTQFKVYGEAFDPELSNLRIFTVGAGFRPAANMFVDLVYHKYKLDKVGNDLRSSALTALINQDDTRLSKSVGDGIDLIVGFRNLFGIRRLGFEVRAGVFFPGDAYRIEEGDPNNPTFRKGDKSISVLAVFIY